MGPQKVNGYVNGGWPPLTYPLTCSGRPNGKIINVPINLSVMGLYRELNLKLNGYVNGNVNGEAVLASPKH